MRSISMLVLAMVMCRSLWLLWWCVSGCLAIGYFDYDDGVAADVDQWWYVDSGQLTNSDPTVLWDNSRQLSLNRMISEPHHHHHHRNHEHQKIGPIRKRQDNANHGHHHHQCRTIQTQIQVSKEDRSATGELVRVCEGQVEVSKCEGLCVSNLRPSVNVLTGLLKECICCREGVMKRKEVRLSTCFDADGNPLTDDSILVTLTEPQECSCFRCS